MPDVMNIFITIVAIIMVADSLFTLANLSKVESILQSAFPKMDIKKLATIEGLVGLVILVIKYSTQTIT